MSLDREYLRSDEETVKALEKFALKCPNEIPEQFRQTKEYLALHVLPHIEAALKATARQRPKCPLEFFSYYLLSQRDK